jgi:tRNA threonylcarbamoyladenosine modification (KEOPS) complex Cgi121 subunit
LLQERIDGKHFLIQGLAECKNSDPNGLLRRMRAAFPAVQLQFMRADRIGGREHLHYAARNAVRAFSQDRQRSHTLAVELLLYTSCQRQISKAIKILGLEPGTSDVVLAALSSKSIPPALVARAAEELNARLDDGVWEISSSKKAAALRKTYGITRVESEASKMPVEGEDSVLKRLIIERSALLAVQN